MFELGILSDEVSSDFARSCELIKSWGLSHVELRTLWGKNILELSGEEIEQALVILARYELQVSALASPIFKSPLDGSPKEVTADFSLAGAEGFEAQLSLLERACGLCKPFRTCNVRVFTFWRQDWSEELVRQIGANLLQAADVAKDYDVRLVVENEPVCNVRQGWEMGELFARVKAEASPQALEHLAILWDPGNALYAGEEAPYPDGYRMLCGHKVAHLHLKDVLFDEEGKPHCVPLGSGKLDVIGQLRHLAKDGYGGVVVLEPHYRPAGIAQEEAALTCVSAAQRALREAFGEA
jgi:sugar phosphate isomerase/epimerase